MKLKWNIVKLRELLSEKETELELEKESNRINTKTFSSIDQIEYDIQTLRYMLSMPLIDVKKFKNNMTCYKILASQIDIKNVKIPTYLYKSKLKDVGNKDMIDLVKFTLNEDDKYLLERLIDNEQINISHNDSMMDYTGYIIGEGNVYINVNYAGPIRTPLVLMHELGHAKQYLDLYDRDEFLWLYTSYFNEVDSILNEMIFLDEISMLLPKEEVKREKYYFLLNYIKTIDTANDTLTSYQYSYLVAHYFFDLYKNNRILFEKKYKKFNDLVKTNIDENSILYSLKISSDDMTEAYKNYIKKYRK